MIFGVFINTVSIYGETTIFCWNSPNPVNVSLRCQTFRYDQVPHKEPDTLGFFKFNMAIQIISVTVVRVDEGILL